MTRGHSEPTRLPVVIVGAGVIGTSVAYACLQAGHRVALVDRPERDWTEVTRELRRQYRLTRLTAPDRPAPAPAAVTLTDDLSVVGEASIVIENVTEDWQVKADLYGRLRALLAADSFVLANTSAIPISRLAALSAEPSRVVGVHFMNPVPMIDVVEVVRGEQTSSGTVEAATAFLAGMSKQAVVVGDSPGFVINRILMVVVNEAAKLVAEGVATAHDIDRLFKGCLGHRMGPARTGDLIGLDTIVNTLRVLELESANPMFQPAARLTQMVCDGHLGMKSGHGFYDYAEEATGA